MAIYPAFLRPIEITSSNNSFSTDAASAGSYTARTIPVGVYAHIGTLLHAFQTACSSDPGAYTMSLTADFKVRIQCGAAFDLRWDNNDLPKLLGFTGNIANKTDTTATYTPENCWLPTYARASQDYFELDIGGFVDGVQLRDGNYHAIATGAGHERTRFVFQFEPAVNVSPEFATIVVSLGGSYYPEQVRCFEEFSYRSRVSRPSQVGKPRTTGFWFFPDRTDVAVEDAETVGGTSFALSSGADDHVLCSMTSAYSAPSAALPNSRARWNVEFAAVTTDLPIGWL